MTTIQRILLATAAFLAPAIPASAQMASTATEGPSLLWVWAWILIAGVVVMIIGTSMGVGRR